MFKELFVKDEMNEGFWGDLFKSDVEIINRLKKELYRIKKKLSYY